MSELEKAELSHRVNEMLKEIKEIKKCLKMIANWIYEHELDRTKLTNKWYGNCRNDKEGILNKITKLSWGEK